MGEKSGGLWLIVIVVVLAGILIAGLTVFLNGPEGALSQITDTFKENLNLQAPSAP